MKKFWGYLSAFLVGIIAGLITMVMILKGKLSNNTIQIRRPKIKNSPEAKQDFTSEIKSAVDKTDRIGKRDQRKVRRQNNKIKKQKK